MYIKKIILNNFRNYDNLDIDFHEKINLFTGNNAQGKTNLLESIYIMSLGKSFRTNKDSEMINFNEDYGKAKSISIKDNRELEVEIIYGKEGKTIKIDGLKTSKNADILENVYIVIFSPEDLKIVKDEPEKRRKFIDRELCQLKPIYYKNLARYKKILQQRNALLKQNEIDESLLYVWDKELSDYGAKIIHYRKDFIEKLDIISSEIHNKITNGKEIFELFYESNIEVNDSLEAQKELFLEKLQKNSKKDIFRRTTSIGPHKDDLKIIINEIDIRHFGSQGQQRTAALSLKLAEIKLIKEETGEDAILLLDDVLSELDKERQSFLINSLNDVQLFITATDIEKDLEKTLPKGFTFLVENGKISIV